MHLSMPIDLIKMPVRTTEDYRDLLGSPTVFFPLLAFIPGARTDRGVLSASGEGDAAAPGARAIFSKRKTDRRDEPGAEVRFT